MARWLFKEEPKEYSFTDLERDGETTWSGIANALALRHLRAVRQGDEVLFYHTGKDKAVIGIMTATAVGEADGMPFVKLKPVRRLAHPVTLAAIREDEAFANWELVRISRLSVMPVPDRLWSRLERMARSAQPARGKRKAAG